MEKVLRPPTAKPEDIVQAMKKLDANLVAYLSKDDVSVDDSFNLKQSNSASSISQLLSDTEEDREQQMLHAFKSISAIKLQLEALTLQPEGTKRMELMQSEIRPIFTIECQLSNELIKYVPRYDLFHVMQFESEKFQSLTQCTRFGQEAKRNIKMLNENDYDEQGNLNFGRIHYTVWWREPGTCLNEMLGMGVLELDELYNASLLEQCKCITINRRGIHLASLYLKISLLIENQSSLIKSAKMINLQRILKETTTKQCNGDNEEEEKKGTSQINIKSNVVQSNNKPQFEDTANPAQNNNIELHSTNFTAETSKVRLLKGFIYANEARNLDDVQNYEYFLVCRRFWHEEIATAVGTAIEREVHFKYQEQFAVINDEKFLRRVEKQFLRLEVWRRMINDGNGNKDSMWLLGVVHLPLHQFYIAYRDSTITNHVCKGKLPVISVDAWVPLLKNKTTEKVGELKCLLAVGSEEQINTLKENRGFTAIAHTSLEIDNALFTVPSCSGNNVDSVAAGIDSTSNPKLKNVTDLLDMLQKALNQPPVAKPTTELKTLTQKATSSNIKPLAETNANSFKFILDIQYATGLPLNPPAKGRKALKNTSAISKRYPPNEAPSTYVTFQADEGYDKLYKSHEGMVYATNIIEKSTHPEWVQRFHVSATTEYLTNPKKLFILKIWKKALTNNEHTRGQPTPMEDAIIGFSALDLTVLLTKLRVSGWFNIVDFNGRINGQIKINCQQSADLPATAQSPKSANLSKETLAPNVDAVIDQFENTLDLTHMNLGQAIKRKFTELEEISQRLRTRLTDVTGEQIASTFDITALDNWETMRNVKDDDFYLNEFEHDINTSATEESGVISATPSNTEPEEKVTNVISSTFDSKNESKE
ncbi:uncharacterized protein LOC119668485 isoform X2 [Teleopsis dalmanni]|uniref:uncharacterized protein LOC119668485 isoform X2 n=1 Tax=Teleopsis dalmanni TaxID=139649 RepID=UPI0018CCC028|nr:uncharacterized protein LOC119668485 isoform X2 [Teleopsis dalmanni]